MSTDITTPGTFFEFNTMVPGPSQSFVFIVDGTLPAEGTDRLIALNTPFTVLNNEIINTILEVLQENGHTSVTLRAAPMIVPSLPSSFDLAQLSGALLLMANMNYGIWQFGLDDRRVWT